MLDFLRRGRVAQLVRAPALQAGCRGFESLLAHHTFSVASSFVGKRFGTLTGL